jgi:hypothetical protein
MEEMLCRKLFWVCEESAEISGQVFALGKYDWGMLDLWMVGRSSWCQLPMQASAFECGVRHHRHFTRGASRTDYLPTITRQEDRKPTIDSTLDVLTS